MAVLHPPRRRQSRRRTREPGNTCNTSAACWSQSTGRLLAQLVLPVRVARCRQLSDLCNDHVDVTVVELVPARRRPAVASGAAAAEREAPDCFQMFTRVVEIDDVHRRGEAGLGQIPNPGRTIAEDNRRGGALESPSGRLGGYPHGELLRGLDGPHVGGRGRVTKRPAFRTEGGLREDTAELRLAVLAVPSAALPARPCLSFGTAGTPVPSIAI